MMVPLDIVFLGRNFVIVDIESMLIELVGTPDSELLVYRPVSYTHLRAHET